VLWGTVEGVRIDLSDQATLEDVDGTQLHLWQRNQVAVRAEIEIGFAPTDLGRAVKLLHSGALPAPRTRRPAKKATPPGE
jgi:hypothetical protein